MLHTLGLFAHLHMNQFKNKLFEKCTSELEDHWTTLDCHCRLITCWKDNYRSTMKQFMYHYYSIALCIKGSMGLQLIKVLLLQYNYNINIRNINYLNIMFYVYSKHSLL